MSNKGVHARFYNKPKVCLKQKFTLYFANAKI